LQRLRAEVASDLEAFRSRVNELRAPPPLSSAGRPQLAEAAVALHHAYGAVEAALSRIARAIDDGLPEGPDWHQSLLHVMALAIPSVRPPVLSKDALDVLQRLLAFRHFFRHAYAIDLDGSRLEELRLHAIAVEPFLRADFERFDKFLAEAAGA
jgi:hypothetical protein